MCNASNQLHLMKVTNATWSSRSLFNSTSPFSNSLSLPWHVEGAHYQKNCEAPNHLDTVSRSTHCFFQNRVQCQRVWNVKNALDFVHHLPHPGLWVWTRVHFCPLCLHLPIHQQCQLSRAPLELQKKLWYTFFKVVIRWHPFWPELKQVSF